MIKKVVAVIGLLVPLILCGNAQAKDDQAASVAGLHAADDAWLKAYTAGDLDNVVALYDENAVIYPPGVPAIEGRASIQAFFTKDIADFAQAGLAFALGANPSGGATGNMGWSSGTWEVKDKDGKVVDSGWYFSVSKKVNGKWLYVRDAWNSNHPTPPPPPGK